MRPGRERSRAGITARRRSCCPGTRGTSRIPGSEPGRSAARSRTISACSTCMEMYISWCQERYQPYPEAKENEAMEDKEDILDIDSTIDRVLRGGSFLYQASVVRCALRTRTVPTPRF